MATSNTRKIIGVHPAPQGHWVGDGFPVRSLFSFGRRFLRGEV